MELSWSSKSYFRATSPKQRRSSSANAARTLRCFKDMFKLQHEYAALVNGEKEKISSFDAYVVGVKCDSISCMNNNYMAEQGQISKGEGRTGRTGQAFSLLLRTKRSTSNEA